MLIILNNIMAIYRKELQGYFASPLAYAIAGVFWLITGYFFIAILLGPEGLIQQVAYRDQMGITEPPIDLPYEFLQVYLRLIGTLSLFVLPMLSMGVICRRTKTGNFGIISHFSPN